MRRPTNTRPAPATTPQLEGVLEKSEKNSNKAPKLPKMDEKEEKKMPKRKKSLKVRSPVLPMTCVYTLCHDGTPTADAGSEKTASAACDSGHHASAAGRRQSPLA